MKILKKTLLSLGIFLLVAIIGLLASLAWLYTGVMSESKLQLASSLHLPLGKVGGAYIYAPAIQGQVDFQHGFSVQAIQELEDNLTLRGVAKAKVKVNDGDMQQARDLVFSKDAKYLQVQEATNTQVADEMFVRPFVLRVKLAQWFASNPDLNTSALRQAQDLVAKLKTASDWQNYAKIYSQDGYGNNYGGDIGYLDLEEAIPEYRDQVTGLALNAPSLVFTRYGIHIVEVLEKVTAEDKTHYHIREIVLKQAGFEQWLKEQERLFTPHWYVQFQLG
jgi:hypothetical protein